MDKHKIDLGNCSQQTVVHIISPQTSRALLWDNGDPDFVGGLCCQRKGLIGVHDVADDFHLDKKSTIERVVWETVDTPDYNWEDLDDLIIYEYGANGPGTELVELLEISNTREYLGDWQGRSHYRYEIDLKGQSSEFDLSKGDYYILLRPYTTDNTGQSFWLTSPAPAGSTSECYFRDYSFFPDWTPSTTVWGSPYDVNFKVYGIKHSSREFNRPILNFLESHPNLFPILQKLLLLEFGL